MSCVFARSRPRWPREPLCARRGTIDRRRQHPLRRRYSRSRGPPRPLPIARLLGPSTRRGWGRSGDRDPALPSRRPRPTRRRPLPIRMRWGPREAARLGLDCSPCFDRTCRFGHYNCLREITADEVVVALLLAGMQQAVHVILQGEAEIAVAGSAAPVGVVRSGECLGEMSLLTGEPREAVAGSGRMPVRFGSLPARFSNLCAVDKQRRCCSY